MPGRKTTKKKETVSDELKELRKLSRAVSDIRKEIDDQLHRPFWKRGASAFAIGIFKGVGLILGTTIFAAITIFVLQKIVDLTPIETSVQDWLDNAVENSIESPR